MHDKKSILSEALAKRIIEAVGSTVNHRINIMNEHGVIMASSDPACVGRYHEVACQILRDGSDMHEAYGDDHLMGVGSGVSVAIKQGGVSVGVLGVAGHPDEIRPMVLVMKLAVETMLQHETEQQAYVLKYTQRQQLEASLVHGAFAEEHRLEHWARAQGLETDLYRIPILFRLEPAPDSQQRQALMAALQAAPGRSDQDVVTEWYGREIIVFKVVEQPIHPGDALDVLGAFTAPFMETCAQQGIRVAAGTGVYVNRLTAYHRSVQRAQWLMSLRDAGDEPLRYFYHHVRSWADACVPATELRDTYAFYDLQDCSETFIRRMLSACRALRRCDYNFVKASRMLFIHKNTLFTWMNDVRQRLRIDPVQNGTDRAFWEYLCLYYEHRHHP